MDDTTVPDILNCDETDAADLVKLENSEELIETDETFDIKIDGKTLEKDDPYAYLDRNDFTSEKFKIEIRGLPKYYGIAELKKLLNDKLKLGSNKVKPPKRGNYWNWIYVCFRSEEDRLNAIKALNGYTWKSKVLSAEKANPAPDPLVKKRKQIVCEQTSDTQDKKRKPDGRSQEECLKDSTTPYWNISYEDQIKRKQENIRELLVDLGHKLVRGNSALASWLDGQKVKHGGLPCELWDIRRSPVCDGYRNKCEFSVGLNEVTGERTVGFRLGSYVRGFTGVAPVDSLSHIPTRMKESAKSFEKFVQQSDLGVFNPETHEGNWRQLTARLSNSTGQLMLIIGIHPQLLPDVQLEKLKEDVKNYFFNEEGKSCNVTSLYLQYIVKKQSGKELPPLQHLAGETHINETLLGMKFRISPEAFFQVNTTAAEVLYSSVRELVEPTQDTTLVDICCGTGSIGLTLSKYCGQVLGLELSTEAVSDAKTNAVNNNVTNCEFFAGRAEVIISSILNRATKKDVIAVVDPPRAGLRESTVLAVYRISKLESMKLDGRDRNALVQLRRIENLTKLVFLSCDPKAAMKNFVSLALPSSKTYRGAPWVPIRAVAVDMFPHTAHCELVVYFERLHSETQEALSEDSTVLSTVQTLSEDASVLRVYALTFNQPPLNPT
uniref:tRNA (uracil(54)-C(5))-methyltransferase n=1 Tax=Timema cristinae TaxID=61476 RepID=A0A7R9CM23_TIMCR|nr:unnamed protein product [Timema cristinae]